MAYLDRSIIAVVLACMVIPTIAIAGSSVDSLDIAAEWLESRRYAVVDSLD